MGEKIKGYRERANLWITEASKGKERTIAIAIFAIALVVTGVMVWNVYFNPDYQRQSLGEVLEEIELESSMGDSSVSLPNIYKLYEEYDNDQELLDMLNGLQAELGKKNPDMQKVEDMYNNIKTHLYEKN